MKNNSLNNVTNSRVGRRWSKETLNELENESSGKFTMSFTNNLEKLDSK